MDGARAGLRENGQCGGGAAKEIGSTGAGFRGEWVVRGWSLGEKGWHGGGAMVRVPVAPPLLGSFHHFCLQSLEYL